MIKLKMKYMKIHKIRDYIKDIRNYIKDIRNFIREAGYPETGFEIRAKDQKISV